MIVNISGGASGIKEYLEKGEKRGRGFSRDEADKRVTLSGDLDVTDTIIKSLDYKENYHHITLSFKEDYVSQEDLQKATVEFIQFMKAAYNDDEINIYAEAHLPKIKSYVAKNGKLVIRKPHVHIVVPNINLQTGLYMEPFGYVNNNIRFIDSYQELYNQKNGFESPKDNLRSEISLESSIVSRHKGDLFTMNRVEKEEILSYIIDNNITSYKEFENYLKTQGTLKTRNFGKDNEYLNIKYPHESKGINLKEFCFSKKFIEEYSHEDKIDFLIEKAEEKFFEKKEAYSAKNTQKQEKLLQEWFDVKSKEIKYINYKSKFYKETYKYATYEQKIEFLAQKEREFYQKYDLEKEIEQELRGYSPMANVEIEQDLSIDNSPTATSSFLSSKIRDFEEQKKLENVVFKSELIKDVYSKLVEKKGVLNTKFGIDDEGIFLNNDSKTRVDLKEFLTEQMNLVSAEIHQLNESILKIEQSNNIKLNRKGNLMSIQVNIKTNDKNKNQVDYLQVGSVDRVGRFTGFVYDQADREHKSSATLFMINDKVVDYEQFKTLPNFNELDDKMKLIVESSKETLYSKELRMNYVKENLTLTASGKTYANSKHNFQDMQPISIGISKFENERKVDQNIFTKAKQFVLENWHKAKDQIQTLLTSRYDLAASNIALAVELQQMKSKLEDIKTYQEAIQKQAELIKSHQAEQQKEAEAAKEQEAEKSPKREFSFGELFEKLDRAGNLRDTVKFAQELEADPDFIKMKTNALDMIKNIKEGKVELSKDEIKEFSLKQAQATNMMAARDIPIKTVENVKSFIDVLKSIKDMSLEKGLDFEHLLNQTLGKMTDKLQTPEQKQAKAAAEKAQDSGIER